MAAQRLSNAHKQQPLLGRAPREHARLFKELSDIQLESSNSIVGGAGGSTSSNGSSSSSSNNGSSGSGSGNAAGEALGVWARLVGEDIQHWEGFLRGPAGTPYEGGCFRVDIQIPGDYPYNPPKMRFTTKIWHPNISSQTGAICLDILKHEWSPALTIRTALLSIQAMLADPVPTVRCLSLLQDPQDAEVAKMMLENPELFVQTAKLWTDTFAKEGQAPNDEKVKKLTEMGFPEEQARAALRSHNWDETLALNFLLEG